MSESSEPEHEAAAEHEDAAEHEAATETRRDFVVTLAGGMAAVGAAAVAWPLIDSMNPSADVLASGSPVNLDVSHLKPGSQTVVPWRGMPIFIAHRTRQELKILQESRDTALLRDPNSSELQQPDYAKNWHRSIKPDYLVVVGICTHLGCIPRFEPKPGELAAGWLGGYFCPCHGSKYDLSGRVYTGVPAPYNLPVPPYHFASNTVVRVGENPKGSKFDLGSVEQL